MKQQIICDRVLFPGCDFVIQLGENRKDTPIRLLQLTDMQLIDAQQRRTPDRLRIDEIEAWKPQLFMQQCGNHILSLVAQSKPDMIFITGDIVYGSFDDNGSAFEWICQFFDKLDIPWAPVFGNHDNESLKGVQWQCDMLENSKNCIFNRGNVTGNGNYSVGIAIGSELIRVMHMADSHGCLCEPSLHQDQLEMIEKNTAEIEKAMGEKIPAFMAFHIPTECFSKAEIAKGYKTEEYPLYTIGVDVAQQDDDFGFCQEKYNTIKTECDFMKFLHKQHIDGVFVGHCHKITTCIDYEEIKMVFGLKTGQYDYHLPGSLGGTLITLEGEDFRVNHIPSLVPYAPMPTAQIFKDFFVKTIDD